MEKIKLYLEGLDCAGCAAKIEDRINKLPEVCEATLNFSTKLLIIESAEDKDIEKIKIKAKDIINGLEPHVKVLEKKPIQIKSINEAQCESERCHIDSGDIDHYVKGIKEKHENVGHTHEHSHGDLECNNKSKFVKFGVAIAIYVLAITMNISPEYKFILYLMSYLLVGFEVLKIAVKNILKGEVFDENFLMAVATIGAFAIKEYPEAVAVMIFYQIGEMFQDYAVNRSRKSIESLMNIRPDYANIFRDGQEEKVSPEEVNIDDVILVKAGERVPLDGVIIEGQGMLDMSALTGETLPKDVETGDEILAGCINKNGLLKVKVTKSFGESTVSKILDLVENAGNKKAQSEKFITKFAKYYTPIVVFSALALAIIPPVIIPQATFSEWLNRALVFLVVSCPCALVISIPLGFFGGIGAAAKSGILIKGGNFLEALKNTETVVFDKTGTLTKGIFKVNKVESLGLLSKKQLIKLAAYSEYYSNHPIAKSIVSEFNEEVNKALIEDYEEISGKGIKVKIEGRIVLAGNAKLMEENNIKTEERNELGTVVHFSMDNVYLGYMVISDEIKKDSKEAIGKLKRSGIGNIVMLTGDNNSIAEAIGKELGVTKVYSQLLPHDKVEKLEEILNKKSEKGKVIFVGDGINDAPVLARADIGIAMGGVGSDAAIEASDVVIMNDEPMKILKAIDISKETNKIVWQNIIFALTVKIIILILGAFGIATMWEAVFGDVGVALIAIINSMRIIGKYNHGEKA